MQREWKELYASLSLRILQYLLIRVEHVNDENDAGPEEKLKALMDAMYDVYEFDPLIIINMFHLQSSETLKNLSPQLMTEIKDLSRKSLGSIAKIYRRRDLAEAIILPNKSIAQGFKTNLLVLDNGKIYTGFVTDETGDTITIRDIDMISITGLEIVCQLGPVTLRDVALFGPTRGITTEAFGSLVLPVADILANGMDYYPDYWQMLSVVYGDVDECCGGDVTVIANAYFDDTASSLFEVAMFHIEATIPYGEDLWFTFGLEAKPTGVDWMKFSFGVSW